MLYNPFHLSESIAGFPLAIWKERNDLKDCLPSERVSLMSRQKQYVYQTACNFGVDTFNPFLSLFAAL